MARPCTPIGSHLVTTPPLPLPDILLCSASSKSAARAFRPNESRLKNRLAARKAEIGRISNQGSVERPLKARLGRAVRIETVAYGEGGW